MGYVGKSSDVDTTKHVSENIRAYLFPPPLKGIQTDLCGELEQLWTAARWAVSTGRGRCTVLQSAPSNPQPGQLRVIVVKKKKFKKRQGRKLCFQTADGIQKLETSQQQQKGTQAGLLPFLFLAVAYRRAILHQLPGSVSVFIAWYHNVYANSDIQFHLLLCFISENWSKMCALAIRMLQWLLTKVHSIFSLFCTPERSYLIMKQEWAVSRLY